MLAKIILWMIKSSAFFYRKDNVTNVIILTMVVFGYFKRFFSSEVKKLKKKVENQ